MGMSLLNQKIEKIPQIMLRYRLMGYVSRLNFDMKHGDMTTSEISKVTYQKLGDMSIVELVEFASKKLFNMPFIKYGENPVVFFSHKNYTEAKKALKEILKTHDSAVIFRIKQSFVVAEQWVMENNKPRFSKNIPLSEFIF